MTVIPPDDAAAERTREDERRLADLQEANKNLFVSSLAAQSQAEEAALTALRQEQFLATIAHELRNPLAPIRSTSEVLRLLAASDPRLTKIHEIIERQVAHMARLLDDLLDVARMASGKIELQRGTVALHESLEQAIETIRPLIDQRSQRLGSDIPLPPIYVDGDPVRLTQVFSNLLHNAAKYTAAGGTINVTARLNGATAVVKIRDGGVGIAKENLERVFELFAQAGHSGGTVHGGLGIGLTVVRAMVEMHGGTVTASSEGVGHGSEFEVSLPALPEPAGPAPIDRRDAQADRRMRCRIVLIDDNTDANISLQLFLQLVGHEVNVASDAASGLALVRAMRPQIVVCDIGLPDLDGYAVAGLVKEEMGDEMPLMVALTGYGTESDRARSIAAGFDHHLVKPLNPATLQLLVSARLAARTATP